jgi:ATP-binding cassette subfamily C protein
MSPNQRIRFAALVASRALLGLLDLLGIAAVGFLTASTASGLTTEGRQSESVNIAGISISRIDSESLPLFVLVVLLLFLSKAFFSVLLTKSVALFVATIEAKASRKIAEISFGGDLGDVRVRSREEMMYSIQSGSTSAFNTILNSTNTLITEASLFIILLVGFFFVDAAATLGAILYFGLVVFMIQFFIGSLMTKAGDISAEKTVQATVAISDLFSVFRELLVLGKRDKYIDKIYEFRSASATSTAKLHYLGGMPRYIIEASLLVGLSLFILSQALSGDIVRSAGTIGVFLAGGFRLTAALLPLQHSMLAIKSAIPSAKTAYDILELRGRGDTGFPHQNYGVTKHANSRGPIGVEFKDVYFTYPGAQFPALQNFSLRIEPGSQVALMGSSGAGKSTIADLMTRVLSPTSGEVVTHFLERTSSKNSPHEIQSGRVSYVPQRPGLVSGTILQNVALAMEEGEVDRSAVVEALELAHLGELILSLPEGVDTQLGKLQDSLSGGQMQRLGLARALFFNPGLLVMDEATSALDAESEAEIQKALIGMRGRVTVVLIAHRLNTIQHADKVALIEDGTLVDTGSFREIRSRNPSVERIISLMNVRDS